MMYPTVQFNLFFSARNYEATMHSHSSLYYPTSFHLLMGVSSEARAQNAGREPILKLIYVFYFSSFVKARAVINPHSLMIRNQAEALLW